MSHSSLNGYSSHLQYHNHNQRTASSRSIHETPLAHLTNGHGADHYQHYHEQQQKQQYQQPNTPMSAGTSSPGEPEPYPPQPFPKSHHHSSGNSSELISRLVTPAERSPFRSPTVPSTASVTKRPKSHVASACVNCKKAHLACDVARPCTRCVGLGKQDTCHDVQHKKRGRPRLRDERSHSFEVVAGSHASPASSPTSIHSTTYRSSHRVLKSHPSHEFSRLRRHSLTPREETAGYSSGYFPPQAEHHDSRGSRISLPPITHPTAYLTPNLVIVKSTERLRELLGYPAAELDGYKSLFDIVLHTDRDKVYQLSRRIQQEIHQRGQRYEDPPQPALYQAIQAIRESDVPPAIPGSAAHSETLHLRRPDGQYIRIRIQATLAFHHVYFVVVEFSLANEMPPPLQLQSNPSPYPTPSSAPALNSPSFLTSSAQRPLQPEHPGPQSPYSHQHYGQVMERPRTVHPDPHYPPPPPQPQQYSPYPSPTHPPSTYYQPPPPSGYSSKNGIISPGLQPSDLQLPPLQLNSNTEQHRQRSTGQYDVPRRERIGVHEVLG